MSTDNGQDESQNESKTASTLAGEMDKLLRLAEELQAQVDKQDESSLRATMFMGALIGMLVSSVASMIGIWLMPGTDTLSRSVITAVSGALVLAGTIMSVFLLSSLTRSRRKLKREKYALSRVVDLLREVERKEVRVMRPLQRAEFRLRLSRFGIGRGEQLEPRDRISEPQ